MAGHDFGRGKSSFRGPAVGAVLTAVGVALTAAVPAAAQVNLPEGFEVVEFGHSDAQFGNDFPHINNCGQVVVQHKVNSRQSEVFMYDNGVFMRLTHDAKRDRTNGTPTINDDGTVLFVQGNRFRSKPPAQMFMYKDGEITPLGIAGGVPEINSAGHFTYDRLRKNRGCKLRKDILFNDGDSERLVFRSLKTDQGPDINDLDQIVWMHSDFCLNPWEGDIRLWQDGDVTVLPSVGIQTQGPSINNDSLVAWGSELGAELWDGRRTILLAPTGGVVNLNNLGEVYMNRFDERRNESQPWLYKPDELDPFFRLADDEFRHTRGNLNDWSEAAWIVTDRIGLDSRVRFLRRIRTGDARFDGDVDLVDYATFASCLTGPGRVNGLCDCRFLDIDTDGDVDLGDFALFQRHFTGPK